MASFKSHHISQFLHQIGFNSMEEEQLIPGLPDDIGLECLSRLHYTSHPSASRTCRRWLNLLQSRQFHSIRKHLSYTTNIACLLQCLPPPEEEEEQQQKVTISSSPTCVITLFDPVSRIWDRIAPVSDSLPLFCQIASTEGKLVVMGGWDPVSYIPVSSVFVYDFVTRRWSQGNDMPSKRSFFAIGATGGRVFVAGGHDVNKNALNSAWIYDVRSDEWSELTRMSLERDECEGLVIGDEFWVVSGYRTEHQGVFEPSAEAFRLSTGEWRRVDGAWNAGLSPRSCARLGEDGRLTSWGELDSAVSVEACGLMLGAQCLVMGSAHQGGPFGFFIGEGQNGKLERINVSDQFSGLVQSSCCAEV